MFEQHFVSAFIAISQIRDQPLKQGITHHLNSTCRLYSLTQITGSDLPLIISCVGTLGYCVHRPKLQIASFSTAPRQISTIIRFDIYIKTTQQSDQILKLF